TLAGCNSTDTSGNVSSASGDDWSYIENKGEMVIGITYFEPMNYKNDSGKLTGFETEFAEKVCEELGVKATFQKIDWDSKEVELNSKTIDCIWNGLTITDERKENMDISTPYMENKQVMITKAENADKYKNAEDLIGATVVAEKKSAGEDVAKNDEFFAKADYVPVDSQAKALLEVKSGTADIAVIDYVMSIGTIKNGSDYKDLKVVEGEGFSPEQYGIAIRKNSPETLKKINDAIQQVADNGDLKKIAEKYNLQDLILVESK
ncbi:MAG: transporter substrate-binding domain-containing protein, partial [Acutalibacteraceae bacterium]|nr:transporter substrate-binding domain-containing protein [Acutalibacteraceae bacterium]